MKEAFEKVKELLKENLIKEKSFRGRGCWMEAVDIVNQVAEEYKDRIFINGQCCWQSCACTEKCQECNRYTLSDADIDWYESIEAWNDEFGTDINVGSKWIPCKDRQPDKPKCGEESYLVQERHVITPYSAYWDGECWSDSECEVLDEIIAWQPLPAPYKPKGE